MIETINQAMNALDSYWAKHGTPDHRVIAQIHGKLEEHSSGCDDDWKALLDAAMGDLGYRIEWQGDGVYTLARKQADGNAADQFSQSPTEARPVGEK